MDINDHTIQLVFSCQAPNGICVHRWVNGCMARYWTCEYLTAKRKKEE